MKYAVVFPGQGSQKVGMGLLPFIGKATVDEVIEEASDILNLDVNLAFKDESLISDINLVQPLLLTAEVAWWKILQSLVFDLPNCVAGHSLGEYGALVASEVLTFSQALKIVMKRSSRMNASSEREMGMLVVVGLSQEQLSLVCQEVSSLSSEYVAIANLNSEQQFVLSGFLSSCRLVMDEIKIMKARLAKLLPIKVASHCLLMKEAALNFSRDLEQFNFSEPKVPVFSNVDAAIHNSSVEIKELLVQQMFNPVNWVGIVNRIDADLVIECGPGKVLINLIKRIRPNLQGWSLSEQFTEIKEIFNG